MTPIIPRAKLFGNPSRILAQISPDGAWLTWLAPHDGVMNIWLAPADDIAAAVPVTKVTGRPIMSYDWAYDGRNILFSRDENGDENWNVFAVDRDTAEIRNLTPLPGIAGQLLMTSLDRPGTVLVGINDRDKSWHDVFAVDLATGERKLAFENTREFGAFVFDSRLQLRIARQPNPSTGGGTLHRFVNGGTEPFMEVAMGDDLTFRIVMFNRAGTHWTMFSPIGRNTAAVIRVDAATGTEILLAEDSRADIEGAIVDPETFEIDAVSASYVRQEWTAINPAIAGDLAFLRDRFPGSDTNVVNQSSDNKRWVVVAYSPEQPATYFLYDRSKQTVTELFSARPELKSYRLRPMQGHVIKSRDGLDLVSYLTLPDGVEQARPSEPLPMVLEVHGGPWARDYYGYRGDHQWLANRGYAVLSVNYRASTGLGKDFMNAGDKEHAGKMHDDLLDAVDWAVREGIAQRDKVAIMGASYGGYATLVGMTFTPEVFCCGVSIVGISNLVTLLQTLPPYWAEFADQMYRRFADPRTEEGRAWLTQHSPLSRVDQIRRPLLIGHGANDVRCKLAEADQIVTAMLQRSLPVTYVVYPDEGHGFARPENRLSFNAIVEAFLAEHLGGRVESVGDDFAGSSVQVREGAGQIAGLRDALAAMPAA